MLPRKRHTSRKFKVVLLLVIFSLLCYKFDVYSYAVFYAPCDDKQSIQIIDNMCRRYRNGQVTGSSCHHICESQKITFQTCANHRGGKIVLITNCSSGACVPGKSVQAVLKTANLNGSVSDENDSVFFIQNVTKKWLKYLTLQIISRVKDKLRRKLRKTEISKLIFDSENFSHQDTTVATLLSGWRLVEQNEYLFTKSHQHVSYYPKIYGTCGSFYLTEYIPPDLSYFPNFLITKEVSWNMRVTVAMEILSITESMDNNFHEPLHFCDVKVWNYGISPVGEVKVIDTDSMYYESDLTDTMGKLNCTSHEHCDFNDCHGFCDFTTGKCRPQRTNNNLQKICQDILSDDPKNFFAGLVHNPPTDLSNRITTLVQECANPGGSHGILSKARSPTPAVYYHKLRHILQKSLVLYKTTQNAHNKYV